MRWAIVIGIDDYVDEKLRLTGAVADARSFRDWVVSDTGGGVRENNLRYLPDPSKDEIITAISEVVAGAAGGSERLYFYFSGHGLTARVAGRDESALVTPGFDALHTDHSLAVRSLTEHFETTPFADQFFFIDACRDIPWGDREFEIGRWPLPRRRDPGVPPVQQFILYATSPGRTAAEVGFPGEAQGAFSGVLMAGLEGGGQAKAWSWVRNCYEVRWDRLATYIHDEMDERRPDSVPPERWTGQIPQDAGSRGVAGGDRDPPVVSYPSGKFPNLGLTVELAADSKFDEADIKVLDAVGNPVVSVRRVKGTSERFTLPPRTYAVQGLTPEPGSLVGTLKAPVDLYKQDEVVPLPLSSHSAPAPAPASDREEPTDGEIAFRSLDSLAVAEIRDEAGRSFGIGRAGEQRALPGGFYRVRQVAPEETSKEDFVMLPAGESREVVLEPSAPPAPAAAALAEGLGGSVDQGWVRLAGATDPAAFVQPSTVVTAAVGATLHGHAMSGLGLEAPPYAPAVAVLAVAADGDVNRVRALSVRMWALGHDVPNENTRLEPTGLGIGAFVQAVAQPGRHWVSIGQGNAEPIVVSVPVLEDRLATLVIQVEEGWLRLYQFHPKLKVHVSSSPDRLRQVEYLQRLLLAGRLDGVGALAEELAAGAADDPLAGLLAGYVLLRLGRHDALEDLLEALRDLPAGISDAHILRGERAAALHGADAGVQSFLEAINAGIPVFAEGLTRLVEGLRVSGFVHPRGALVRHLFQRHARGLMWAAFRPVRKAEPGRLVVSGADLGFEG